MKTRKTHRTLKKAAQKEVGYHLVFWAASFYVLLNIFTTSGRFQQIDYVYTGIFLVSLILPVYVNLYVLHPLYLRKERYLAFAAFMIANLLLFSYFNHLLFQSLIDYFLPGYYFISYYSYVDIVKFFASFFLLTLLLKLTREWFQLKDIKNRIVTLEKEKADAELKALTQQINPHFLFNTLNVLYSLAVRESKKTPEAILNLSDLLRYVIYDSNSDRIPLGSEIAVMKKYIDLQKYRVARKTKIKFKSDVKDEKIKIAPMLFLPLLENSFKHGVKKDISNTYLNLFLRADENSLSFVIENNRVGNGTRSHLSPGGVGLRNIQNRLKLMYPDKHIFKVEKTDNRFKVGMYINLN